MLSVSLVFAALMLSVRRVIVPDPPERHNICIMINMFTLYVVVIYAVIIYALMINAIDISFVMLVTIHLNIAYAQRFCG